MALYGIDVSHWNGVGAGDGNDFVICKATEGVGFVDNTCDAHYQRAKANGQLLGVYHFARPDKNSAEAEAEFFVNNIKGYIGEAILVLDFEVATTNVGWAKAWLDKVYSLTGVKPLIYISASPLRQSDWSSVKNADYGLWIAGYPAKYNVKNPPRPEVGDMPYSTAPWSGYAIWQYSSSAGTLDRNIANMDRDGWQRYAAKSGDQPAPAPTPAPAPPVSDAVIYTVKKGDTLSAIAARYNTTYQKIAADNGIADPNRIFVNQRLTIYPGNGGSSSSEKTYTVQKGDSLSSIAAKYNTTWQKIYNDNRAVIGGNPSLIYPGQVLVIR